MCRSPLRPQVVDFGRPGTKLTFMLRVFLQHLLATCKTAGVHAWRVRALGVCRVLVCVSMWEGADGGELQCRTRDSN